MNNTEKLRAAQATARDYERFANELLTLINRIVKAAGIAPNEHIVQAVRRLRHERDQAMKAGKR